jgi:general secretion pathway protein G
VLGYLSDSRVRSARLQIDSLAAALDLFYLDTGRYPSASEGLQALIAKTPSVDRWNGPYLQQSALPVDPWGQPYEYRVPGENSAYEIVSLGADGRPGGTDDASDIATR